MNFTPMQKKKQLFKGDMMIYMMCAQLYWSISFSFGHFERVRDYPLRLYFYISSDTTLYVGQVHM